MQVKERGSERGADHSLVHFLLRANGPSYGRPPIPICGLTPSTELIGAQPREIVFASCAAESNNAAIHAVLKAERDCQRIRPSPEGR